ncbi:ferredoxin [Amycolatopsis sp. cmx-11-12]|uniref:ferredoxin n=1 Tax=Amycolatopsis sp. cmx-11-12 TaxID=2785795 RepID=UPI0039175F68
MMKIEADRAKCDGLGMCEAMAPDFFEVGDDGTVVVLDEWPGEEHRRDLSAAVDSCPVLALKLRD